MPPSSLLGPRPLQHAYHNRPTLQSMQHAGHHQDLGDQEAKKLPDRCGGKPLIEFIHESRPCPCRRRVLRYHAPQNGGQ